MQAQKEPAQQHEARKARRNPQQRGDGVLRRHGKERHKGVERNGCEQLPKERQAPDAHAEAAGGAAQDAPDKAQDAEAHAVFEEGMRLDARSRAHAEQKEQERDRCERKHGNCGERRDVSEHE